tara:strand:+ start:16 stop:894 length:879 start_codon:yes stop_codon:yes gene_type:complete
MKTAICFFASFYTLFAQNDSLVKYYSTEMIRSNIIKGRPEIEVDVNEAHFKAVYYPSGRLKSIEYIPANMSKNRKNKITKDKLLKLYYLKWDPKRQELSEGITKNSSKGIAHYQALLTNEGIVSTVDYFDKNNIKLWSFQMNWDDYDRSNKYDIEFYSNRNLYELNKELFAPDLSTIRTGWKARYEVNSDGKPEKVKVMDALGNLFYYYEFTYTKKWLKSKYYKQDSTFVGSHTTRFAKGKKIAKITYYDENGEMKKAISYEYPNKNTMIVSSINSKGKIIEKRLIPLNLNK